MEKKIPLRKCLGCGEMKPKKELKRIVKTNDGKIFIDDSGKANGRGTYVCSSSCAMKVVKKKLLDRAFDEKISNDLYNELAKSLESEDCDNE